MSTTNSGGDDDSPAPMPHGDWNLDEVAWRSQNIELWNQSIERLLYSPVVCSKSWIEYQTRYLAQRGAVLDLSMVVLSKGEPVAVWPLCLTPKMEGQFEVHSYTLPIVEPLLLVDPSSPSGRRTQKRCLEILFSLLASVEIQVTSVILDRAPLEGTGGLGRDLVRRGGITTCAWDYRCILLPTVEERWKMIRRDGRQRINRARKELETEVYDSRTGPTPLQFDPIAILHQLHIEAAGRETRAPSTWQAQSDAYRNGEAFIVVATHGLVPVGAALVHCSRDEAIYAVGAYDRTKMAEGLPIGHLIQHATIEHLANERHILSYGLNLILDSSSRTSKERGIDMFKETFCTHVFPRPIITFSI